MLVAATQYFGDQGFVPMVQSCQPPFPSTRFRMPPISRAPLSQHDPQTVQLPVFTEKMLTA